MSSTGAGDRAITASARLECGSLGDADAAIALRRGAETLLDCGLSELVVDLARVAEVEAEFVATLAALTRVAEAHHCRLVVVGVESRSLTDALEAAPLEDLFAIYAATRETAPEPARAAVPGPRRPVSGDPAPHEGRHAAGRSSLPVRNDDDLPRDRAG